MELSSSLTIWALFQPESGILEYKNTNKTCFLNPHQWTCCAPPHQHKNHFSIFWISFSFFFFRNPKCRIGKICPTHEPSWVPPAQPKRSYHPPPSVRGVYGHWDGEDMKTGVREFLWKLAAESFYENWRPRVSIITRGRQFCFVTAMVTNLQTRTWHNMA